MKLLGFAVALSGSFCLAVSLDAKEVVTCKSPDGKFALRHVYEEQQPFAGDTMIIEVATGKTLQPLDSNWSIGELKLLWSRDSQRVAYFVDNTHSTENAGGCSPVIFLAILQYLFGNWYCFLEFTGVAQLIDLLNHIAHLRVGLSHSGAHTKGNCANPADAWQRAVDFAIGLRKASEQFTTCSSPNENVPFHK